MRKIFKQKNSRWFCHQIYESSLKIPKKLTHKMSILIIPKNFMKLLLVVVECENELLISWTIG